MVSEAGRGRQRSISSSGRQRRRKEHRLRDEEEHCRRMLLDREKVALKRMLKNGHFYSQKSKSANCLLQNGVLGCAALLKGGTLDGCAVEGLQKAMKEEKKEAERLEGMEVLAPVKKADTDWLRKVTYYWASPRWKPPVPQIDEGKETRRPVVHHVVEELLARGEFEVADGEAGVVMPHHFVKMPVENNERVNRGLYGVLAKTVKALKSSGRHRCRDRSGQRMRALLMAALVGLSACGADDEPEPVETGITVSGGARIGVTGAR